MVMDMAETWVKGHWSHSRSGERIWIPEHKMKENEHVHEHHLKTVEKEIMGLKELEHRRKREAEATA